MHGNFLKDLEWGLTFDGNMQWSEAGVYIVQ